MPTRQDLGSPPHFTIQPRQGVHDLVFRNLRQCQVTQNSDHLRWRSTGMNVAGDYLDFRPIAVHQRNAHRHCVGTFQRRAAPARSQSPLNHLANRGQTQRIAFVSWQPPERDRPTDAFDRQRHDGPTRDRHHGGRNLQRRIGRPSLTIGWAVRSVDRRTAACGRHRRGCCRNHDLGESVILPRGFWDTDPDRVRIQLGVCQQSDSWLARRRHRDCASERERLMFNGQLAMFNHS